MTNATPLRRFDIALSFPGEHRAFVEQVANHLSSKFGKDRILYDKFYEAEFERPDLDVYLPKLYRTESELIVLFLCREYKTKRWCRLEWQHTQLLAKDEIGRILFFCYGNYVDYVELGIFKDLEGMINFEGQSAEYIAELIHKRYRINQNDT